MSNNRYIRTTTDVLSLRFNQDSSKTQEETESACNNEVNRFDLACFICATGDGIRIFNVEPFAQKSFLGRAKRSERRERMKTSMVVLDVGRATYAEMLYRTNLIAYVPADHVTGLPSNVGKQARSPLYSVVTHSTDSSERLRWRTKDACLGTLFQFVGCLIAHVSNKVRRHRAISCSKLTLDSRLLVVLVGKIHILSFPNQCRLLHTIETRDNPRGKWQQ